MKTKEEPVQKVFVPSRLKNYCVIISSMIVILAGLHAASSVLGPFLMATFFAVLLISPVNWLIKRGVASWLALTGVIIAVLGVGVGAATLIGSQIAQFARDIPQYRHQFVATLENYNLDLSDVFPFLKESDDKDGEKQERPTSEKRDAERSGEGARRHEENAPSDEKSRGADESTPEHARMRPVFAALTSNLKSSDSAPDAVAESIPLTSAAQDSDAAVGGVAEAFNVAETSGEGGESLAPPDATSRLIPPKAPDILRDGSLFSDDDANDGADDDALDDEFVPRSDNPAFSAVNLSSQQLFRFLRGLAGELSYFASTALIVTLMLVFMLVETAKIPKKLVAVLGERKFTNTRILNVVEDIRNYMAIKTEMSLLVGVLATILLLISKVQYPLLWGFVAFLLNYIPNIGSVVAAIPPVVLATVEHGVFTGCVDAVGFIAINVSIGYGLEPRLLGRGLGLSPLIVLISLIFFGWLLGPVGMFLSPPLAVVMKIIFQSFPETKWIAALMANTVPKEENEDDEDDDEELDLNGAQT